VQIRFPDSQLHQDIAKSVAVLQILGNLPVTMQNVASLMHPSSLRRAQLDAVRKPQKRWWLTCMCRLGEKDGNLVFLSEKLRDIEQERGAIALRTVDVKRIFNDALRESFNPLPRVSFHGTLAVATGLKVQAGSSVTSLAGDQSTIQTVVELVSPGDYEVARTACSTTPAAALAATSSACWRERTSNSMTWPAKSTAASASQRSTAANRTKRSRTTAPASSTALPRRCCRSCSARSSRPSRRVRSSSGGRPRPSPPLNVDLLEAAKKLLADAADQVFDRYVEAPVSVSTDTAERFLKVGNPAAITSAIDPLGLVQTVSGRPSFKTDHKAMVSIRDYVDKRGTIDGKSACWTTSAADPFGWSPDTTRYILAAMLMAGEIKLKVSGREVTAAGQQAIEALKTNTSFKQIGVALRDERPSIETVGRAAERLDRTGGRRCDSARARGQPGRRQALPALPARLRPVGRAALGSGPERRRPGPGADAGSCRRAAHRRVGCPSAPGCRNLRPLRQPQVGRRREAGSR
jgi:hypothetical protein